METGRKKMIGYCSPITDELRFCLRYGDDRERIWRWRNEKYVLAGMSKRKMFGGGGVMDWAGIL